MRAVRTIRSVVVVTAVLVATSCDGETQPPATTSPSAAASPSVTPSLGPAGSPSPTVPSAPVWHRSLGFSLSAMASDDGGNVYTTGSDPFGPAEDWGRSVAMVLQRSDPDGRQVWSRTWRSPDELFSDAVGSDVTVSPEGDMVYVTGEVSIPPGENRHVRLWAYSSDGDLLWSTEASESAFASSAAASSTGVVVGGYGWLGAWDRDGTPLWVQPFEEPVGEHCDDVADLVIDEEADIYAVGYLDTTPTCAQVEGLELADADIVVQRRSPAGDLVWSRVLTDPGQSVDRAVAVDVAGRGVFVTGEGDNRAWLARLSPDGQIVWEHRWGKAELEIRAVDVSASPWGAVYVLADRRCPPPGDCGRLYLRRYTPEGELEWEWSQRLHGYVSASGVATALDTGLYVAAGGLDVRGHPVADAIVSGPVGQPGRHQLDPRAGGTTCRFLVGAEGLDPPTSSL